MKKDWWKDIKNQDITRDKDYVDPDSLLTEEERKEVFEERFEAIAYWNKRFIEEGLKRSNKC